MSKRPTVADIRAKDAEIAALHDLIRRSKEASEVQRLQDLVNSFEAANIERQGKIETLKATVDSQELQIKDYCKTINTLERKLEEANKTKPLPEVHHYEAVDEDLLRELAIAYLEGDMDRVGDIEEQCREEAAFNPHPQQQIVLDEKGVKRFRRNEIVGRLVDECFDKNNPVINAMNYIARMDVSREDHAQLAQLIGYSVDGYLSLSYALPVKDNE